MAKHKDNGSKLESLDTQSSQAAGNITLELEPQARKIYAPYQLVNLIERRYRLLRTIHAEPTPVLEGVLEAVLVMVNTEFLAIQPQDVDHSLGYPGTS